MLFQDTRDIPYAYITRSDLCVHTKGADTQTHYRLHKVVQRTYPTLIADTAFLY